MTSQGVELANSGRQMIENSGVKRKTVTTGSTSMSNLMNEKMHSERAR